MSAMTWVRSSFCSGGSCVEVDFVRSSFCSSGACVEAGREHGLVLLRDGKLGEASPLLSFSAADWRGFLESVPELDAQLRG